MMRARDMTICWGRRPLPVLTPVLPSLVPVLVAVWTVIGLPASTCRAGLPQGQAYAVFHEANALFRRANEAADEATAKGLYEQAILGYERLIHEAGVHNGGLYYNLANAYLLKGDLGRAILNYRRAEALDPSNPDIQKNLAFARSRRIDQIPVRTRRRVLERLFFWHYDFSTKTRFIIGCAAFGLMCLVLAGRVWFGRLGGWLAAVILLAVLTGAMAVSVGVDEYVRQHFRGGVITAEAVVARQGDGTSYAEAFKDPLHAGTEFDLLERRPDWWHIELADGHRAWIPADAADLI